MPLFERAADWPRRPAALPAVPPPRGALLGDPAEFRIEAARNPHMIRAGGGLKEVDADRARKQWEALRSALAALGLETPVLDPVPGLVDLCFPANPSLVLRRPGAGASVWLGRMAFPCREGEVALHRSFFEARGFRPRELPAEIRPFEGAGDGVQHPGRFLLHAGVGGRSTRSAWEALAREEPGLDILLYRLQDPRFYHLDTALSPLTEETALFVPSAFDAEGRGLLQAAFPRLLEVEEAEALAFAANAWCPDGRRVLIEESCHDTRRRLEREGFEAVPLPTSEYRKSGGSVFCLKQALP